LAWASSAQRFQRNNNSPAIYRRYVADFGTGGPNIKDPNAIYEYGVGTAITRSYPMTVAWARDSRDSVMTPSIGELRRFNMEVAAIGNFKYYRGIYKQELYKPIYRMLILALNGEFDFGHGLGGNPYPLFKNFYAGGIGSVRGFEASTLGTVDANGYSNGGAKRLLGNVELQIPFPGADRSLRMFAFADVGNVFDEGQRIRLQDLRRSAGIGLSWISPVGPLKLSIGKALNAKPGDKLKVFDFQMGTGF